MDEMYVNTDIVDSTASTIDVINSRLDDDVDSVMRNSMARLDSSWQGPAAEHAIGTFKSIMKSCRQPRYNTMQNYVNALHELIAKGYVSVEEQNTSLADAFK